MEWVIGKLNKEFHELTLLAQHSVDDVASAARRGMDDVTAAARRGIGDFEHSFEHLTGSQNENPNFHRR